MVVLLCVEIGNNIYQIPYPWLSYLSGVVPFLGTLVLVFLNVCKITQEGGD